MAPAVICFTSSGPICVSCTVVLVMLGVIVTAFT
jgi:hypothetical protein